MEEIFDLIKEGINQYKEQINKAKDIDKGIFGKNIDDQSLIQTINQVEKECIEYKKQDGNNIGLEHQTYVVLYNGDPKITLELALKYICLNQNCIFMIKDYMFATNSILIEILNKIVKENSINIFIKLYNNVSISSIIDKKEQINKIIYIGDRFYYNQIALRSAIPVIYNGYGMLQIYIDDDIENEFDDILDQVEQVAFKKDIGLDYSYINNFQELADQIGQDKGKNCYYLILTNKKENINSLKHSINNDSKIYMNENPFKEYKFEFQIKSLI